MKSILIKDTTREERERIVNESIGNVSGLCDGCAPGILSMYDDYFDGKLELREVYARFNRGFVDDIREDDDSSCGFAK